MAAYPDTDPMKPFYNRVDDAPTVVKLLAAAMEITPYNIQRHLISISACKSREEFIKWLQSQPK